MEMKYCLNCGKEIAKEAEICPNCGIRVSSIKQKKTSSPGIAAVLSFLWIGLGQIYNGQIGKGFLLMIGFIILCITLIGIPIAIILWIYSIINAYSIAKET